MIDTATEWNWYGAAGILVTVVTDSICEKNFKSESHFSEKNKKGLEDHKIDKFYQFIEMLDYILWIIIWMIKLPSYERLENFNHTGSATEI
jgi:hypothetical protein